ncbi:hypothetical protein T484DRAFT_2697293 [Baffinella frigidus]|nr:hypothetical protein T484DRAFT_2697293 [Cryptophyta sp. CCMP2293]
MFRVKSGGDAAHKLPSVVDPNIWNAHQRGPHRTLAQAEDGAEVTAKANVMDQIHKWWCTLLDPELEALHQGDAFVVTENLQAFLVGLLVLSITVGITLIDVSFASLHPPLFLQVLTCTVVLASLVFATLAYLPSPPRQN